MRLIIVRHGETDRNKDRFFQGNNLDTPLNAEGQRQAEAVARRLATEKIHTIYSSDLPRARVTAEIIARYHQGVQVHYDAKLRERDSGVFFDKTVAEREEAWKASGHSFREWRPKGGESLEDVKHRSGKWFKQLRREDVDSTVMIVGHGLFIHTLLEWAVEEGAEVEHEKYHHDNTGITILDVPVKGAAKIIRLNDVGHLRQKKTRTS